MFKSRRQFKIFSFQKRQTPNFLNSIGEFDFKKGKAWSNKSVNKFVEKVAKSKGYTGNKRFVPALVPLVHNFCCNCVNYSNNYFV